MREKDEELWLSGKQSIKKWLWLAHTVRDPTKHRHTYSGVYPQKLLLNQQWILLSDNKP
jgi:hypothetical protein